MFDFDDLEVNLPLPAREKSSIAHVVSVADEHRTLDEDDEDDCVLPGASPYAVPVTVASDVDSDGAESSPTEVSVSKLQRAEVAEPEPAAILGAGGVDGGTSDSKKKKLPHPTDAGDVQKPSTREWWHSFGLGENDLDNDDDVAPTSAGSAGTSEPSAVAHGDSDEVHVPSSDQTPWRSARSSYEVDEPLLEYPGQASEGSGEAPKVRAGTAAERHAQLFQAYGMGVDSDEEEEDAATAASSGMDAVQGRSFGLQTVFFKVVDDVLPMHLERQKLTPLEVTKIWEEEWGIAHATRVRFEAPDGSPTKWLNAREDFLPSPPVVIRLDGKGSILQAIGVALKQRDSYAKDLSHHEGMERSKAKREFREAAAAPKMPSGYVPRKERIQKKLSESFFLNRRREQERQRQRESNT